MEMEGVSNGGMLYHEVQEAELVRRTLANEHMCYKDPFFSELSMWAALVGFRSRFKMKRQMMQEGNLASPHPVGDYLSAGSPIHNVSLGRDLIIQCLQKALSVWDLQVSAI
ncbi:hypothetical protein NC651_015680 [Populus alba x Populus x berolinensis]|nr:hypothetical protein NC651_015680 [Populus alba x Populus x berolinensis]